MWLKIPVSSAYIHCSFCGKFLFIWRGFLPIGFSEMAHVWRIIGPVWGQFPVIYTRSLFEAGLEWSSQVLSCGVRCVRVYPNTSNPLTTQSSKYRACLKWMTQHPAIWRGHAKVSCKNTILTSCQKDKYTSDTSSWEVQVWNITVSGLLLRTMFLEHNLVFYSEQCVKAIIMSGVSHYFLLPMYNRDVF